MSLKEKELGENNGQRIKSEGKGIRTIQYPVTYSGEKSEELEKT